MQIIESSVIGVRSAVFSLECDDDGLRFTLFPMIHVGEPAFYEDVERRLENCDVILCEGVKSPTVSLLTLSYRFFAPNERLGLVLQSVMKLEQLHDRVVHADVSGDAFERRWSKLPFLWRHALPLIAPAYGLYLRYFGTRALLARHCAFSYRKTAEEVLEGEDIRAVKGVLLGWRDRHLIGVIDQLRAKHRGTGAHIGVVYGAGHMRAVIRHLVRDCRYRIAGSEWVKVFGV